MTSLEFDAMSKWGLLLAPFFIFCVTGIYVLLVIRGRDDFSIELSAFGTKLKVSSHGRKKRRSSQESDVLH